MGNSLLTCALWFLMIFYFVTKGEGGGMGRGVVRIQYRVLRGWSGQFIIEEPKYSYPHPLPQVMNNDQPSLSYLFICFCYSFILFIYLFIYLFIFFNYFFFSLRESTRRNFFYLTYLGSVPINLCLAFIWMRFGILLYREVRKKSERRVGHMWGTRHTAV